MGLWQELEERDGHHHPPHARQRVVHSLLFEEAHNLPIHFIFYYLTHQQLSHILLFDPHNLHILFIICYLTPSERDGHHDPPHARQRVVHSLLREEGPRIHLTSLINLMVSESQPPHKIVNLLFTITNEDKKLTVLRGTEECDGHHDPPHARQRVVHSLLLDAAPY